MEKDDESDEMAIVKWIDQGERNYFRIKSVDFSFKFLDG